jgi:hypothetical protein
VVLLPLSLGRPGLIRVGWVDPRSVEAMRARLAPAFASLGQGATPGTERARLAAEGAAWCAGAPCTLSGAPALFETGRDLEARLSFAQGPHGESKARTSTGTIMGAHTIGELADLTSAERYQLAQFEAIRACPAWASADPAGYGSWAADYYDASTALQAALVFAQGLVDAVPHALWNVTPVTMSPVPIPGFPDAWTRIVQAAHPFVDLATRFIKAGFCPFPDMAGMPQPTAPDLDLSAYKWSDKAAKQVEDVANKIGRIGSGVVVGVVVGVLGLFALSRMTR